MCGRLYSLLMKISSSPFSLPAGPSVYALNAAGRVLRHPSGYGVLEYAPGPRQMADFQALLLHISALLRAARWRHVLADQRRMAPFTEAETAWAHSFWLNSDHCPPGGLVVAALQANDVFARLASGLVRQRVMSTKLYYRVFEHEADALAWLRRA